MSQYKAVFVNVCLLHACVCVFLSEYQRGEEREGRNPGNNNHPSTTGAFVAKSVGLTERFFSTALCSSKCVFVLTCVYLVHQRCLHKHVRCVNSLKLDGSLLVHVKASDRGHAQLKVILTLN